jgi:hypothetical protein
MLSEILLAFLTPTTVGAVILAIRYWKQNKMLKNNEVQKDNIAVQKEKIDLGDIFIEKVRELSEEANGVTILHLKKIDNDLAELKVEMRDLCAYLNGDYKDFKKNLIKKKK